MSTKADDMNTFADLNDYCERTGKKKGFVAEKELGVPPSFFTELCNPRLYRPKVSVDLAVKIARLLNQPVESVVDLYCRIA